MRHPGLLVAVLRVMAVLTAAGDVGPVLRYGANGVGGVRGEDLSGVQVVVINRETERVPAGLFQGLPNLRSVSILDDDTEICSRAFADCPRLNCLYLPRGSERMSRDAFDGCAEDFTRVGIVGGSSSLRSPIRLCPLAGWRDELWFRMDCGEVGSFILKDGPQYYVQNGVYGDLLELAYCEATNRLLRVPPKICGLACGFLGPDSVPGGSPIRDVVLPSSVIEWKSRDGWSYAEGETSTVERVFCEGKVPRGLFGPPGPHRPRWVFSCLPSEDSRVIHVPRSIEPEWAFDHPDRFVVYNGFKYVRYEDHVLVYGALDDEKGFVSIPDALDGLPVTEVAPEVLCGKIYCKVRVPTAVDENWPLIPKCAGEGVRDLYEKYLENHEQTEEDRAVLRLEDASLPLPRGCSRGYGWGWRDEAGDYVGFLREITEGAEKGNMQDKMALANYLEFGRPGLYGIVDKTRARTMALELGIENLGEAFRETFEKNRRYVGRFAGGEEALFARRYWAIRGDSGARWQEWFLAAERSGELLRCTLPTLGIFAEDGPAGTQEPVESAGYDIVKGDYCPPYGQGTKAHLTIKRLDFPRGPTLEYALGEELVGDIKRLRFAGRRLQLPSYRGHFRLVDDKVYRCVLDGKPIELALPIRIRP